MSALRLYGVTALDDENPSIPLPGITVVSFRELDAVVGEAEYEVASRDPEDIDRHREIVNALFSRFPVLPAPYGVTFQSEDVMHRWLEVHYYTLSDALRYVEDRVGARLYVSERDTLLDDGGVAETIDVAGLAADVFRVLRRHSVASTTLRASSGGGRRAAATFLVERDRWGTFADVVGEESRRHPELLFKLTGPWPPYDFVRLQFGG